MSRVVALLPFKAHSERVPGKNFRLLCGQPLYCYALQALLSSETVDCVFIDTDAVDLKTQLAARFPRDAHRIVVIDRPQSLRGDMVPMTAVLSHDVEFVIQTLGSSEEIIFVQTHTTNPLLRPGTIDAAVTAYRAAVPVQHDSLFSVTAVRTRLYDTLGRAVNHNPTMLLRTQDLPPVWEENSCLYIFQARDLLSRQQRIGLRPLLFEMSQQESHDIDTEADWEAVAALMPCALKAGRVTAHTTATHVTAAPAEGVLAPRLRPVPGAPATPQFEVLVTAPYAMPHIGSLTATLRDFGLLVTLPDALAERMSEAQLLALAGRFDGTICGDDAYTPAVLRACSPRLKVVSKWGTGIDAIHAEAARSLGIAVCNTPGAFTQPVADSTLAYMLSFARGVAPTDAAMKAGGWDKVPGKSLSECTVGVVGCGAIGQAVCSRLRGFQATVLVNDPVPPPQKFLAAHPDVAVEKSLAALLAASDYVVLACDLNPSSRHIIDQAALALMRRDAVLVNCSRGGLVDEEALVQALQCGLLAGAGLDVFAVEPLPADSPLRSMANVLLAPHNANASPTAHERVLWSTIANLLTGLGIPFSTTPAQDSK